MLNIENTANILGIVISGSCKDFMALHDALKSVIGDDGEFFHEADARSRVDALCRGIQIACPQMLDSSKPGVSTTHSLRLLWPEAAFIAAVLDNFVLLTNARKLYSKLLPKESCSGAQTFPTDSVVLIHYFQELVWCRLEGIVGSNRMKFIFGNYNDLRSAHFKFPQFDGFCTLWIDLLNMQYLLSPADGRSNCLAALLNRLFLLDENYLNLKGSFRSYAKQEGVYITSTSITGCINSNSFVW